MIKFWVILGKWVGGSKVNLFVIWFDCGLLAVLCCHLTTENVVNLLFLAFRYVAARWQGLLCLASQLVLKCNAVMFVCFRWYVVGEVKG